ncbi:MOSC N-terminal beta barrel domain-containing protein [Aetokthonos hydrillicola Thurmond2011]|uniref:MOSC N-terminal beta barrel domain-containing protein n=1 Tax=Aetokthonos hydrillicola Thurmond2011 TaxID=2712845 RepID=A0AAP5IBR1_9CYAN|nr:MOSC N-terminal beta barrel domain-containing protein [Aetokthonos hydrillicola]MBO3462007.1 MOSC domain-containing protein [Aetokthonos hydrillicola CCALA 1050]MBW4584290.1 MOSC N-terminal beta barrel domain-containing protein [Aetokthonos hydrillicola CCALA 1050]MDR9898501.1 MOSC N-terminal beta barrel domain-containing protein [Aetokthonos hydrillicola Thurmond2011]
MTDVIPTVSRLLIYPIKSLDGVCVENINVLRSGALKHDREFAIFNKSGQFVNGKLDARVHALRSKFEIETNTVALQAQGTDSTHIFHIEKDREALEEWLGEYFGFAVEIKQNVDTGFPDDTVSPGPTIISTATLEAIASWYPGLDVEEIRSRFRANIEISGVPAFWEDRLFAEPEETVNFQIGEVKFMGINPCQRCVVITRDSQTGEVYPNFQKTFVAQRQATLPEWAQRSRFNHFYRLAINTRLPASEGGKTISIGDQVIFRKTAGSRCI